MRDFTDQRFEEAKKFLQIFLNIYRVSIYELPEFQTYNWHYNSVHVVNSISKSIPIVYKLQSDSIHKLAVLPKCIQ